MNQLILARRRARCNGGFPCVAGSVSQWSLALASNYLPGSLSSLYVRDPVPVIQRKQGVQHSHRRGSVIHPRSDCPIHQDVFFVCTESNLTVSGALSTPMQHQKTGWTVTVERRPNTWCSSRSNVCEPKCERDSAYRCWGVKSPFRSAPRADLDMCLFH